MIMNKTSLLSIVAISWTELESLCELWKNNVSPTQLNKASENNSALASHSQSLTLFTYSMIARQANSNSWIKKNWAKSFDNIHYKNAKVIKQDGKKRFS